MKAILRELKRQKEANRAGLLLFKEFESHRRSQTDFILSHHEKPGGRLCVLGAGNCFDLDLPRIAQCFDEVHLVDIDPVAVKKARERLPSEDAGKVHIHAPIDVSGANDKLETWRDRKVSPDALIAFPEAAARAVGKRLPGPFDCVASTCLLSQLLLTYRRVLGEQHPLFQAGLITLLVAHFRVLADLTAEGGEALFITDITTDEIAPLGDLDLNANAAELLSALAQENQIFNYLDPALLASLCEQDPVLSQAVTFSPPERVWRWQNTPHRAFLVYGVKLHRQIAPAGAL